MRAGSREQADGSNVIVHGIGANAGRYGDRAKTTSVKGGTMCRHGGPLTEGRQSTLDVDLHLGGHGCRDGEGD